MLFAFVYIVRVITNVLSRDIFAITVFSLSSFLICQECHHSWLIPDFLESLTSTQTYMPMFGMWSSVIVGGDVERYTTPGLDINVNRWRIYLNIFLNVMKPGFVIKKRKCCNDCLENNSSRDKYEFQNFRSTTFLTSSDTIFLIVGGSWFRCQHGSKLHYPPTFQHCENIGPPSKDAGTKHFAAGRRAVIFARST